MIERPDYSLLHITARLPHGWEPAMRSWTINCFMPEMVEYILCVDQDSVPDSLSIPEFGGKSKLVINRGRKCTVDAWNTAARHSTGKVLICVADDWFPPDMCYWDNLLSDVLPCAEDGELGEHVIDVSTGMDHLNIIICPILTRAYYERPGRGGCPNGELLYPEYISVGSDDDFTEYAWRDGVVIDAKRTLPPFPHLHPSLGRGTDDAVYQWSNRQEAWDTKDRVIARRRSENYAR